MTTDDAAPEHSSRNRLFRKHVRRLEEQRQAEVNLAHAKLVANTPENHGFEQTAPGKDLDALFAHLERQEYWDNRTLGIDLSSPPDDPIAYPGNLVAADAMWHDSSKSGDLPAAEQVPPLIRIKVAYDLAQEMKQSSDRGFFWDGTSVVDESGIDYLKLVRGTTQEQVLTAIQEYKDDVARIDAQHKRRLEALRLELSGDNA